jgi:hypothetical protein
MYGKIPHVRTCHIFNIRLVNLKNIALIDAETRSEWHETCVIKWLQTTIYVFENTVVLTQCSKFGAENKLLIFPR